MASPRRIFAIYHSLHRNAAEIRDFQIAQGDKVSGTVQMLLQGDRPKLLERWAEEMDELCGVLDGSHDDPYILEATQCFYWASLYAVTGGVTWEEICFDDLRISARQTGIDNPAALTETVNRVRALGVEQVHPRKLFMLWLVADHIYRATVPIKQQFDLATIMQADLADMEKRPYLQPIITETADL
jgi:phosphoribosyl-ATP pyrophosphohydrolase